MREAAEYLDLSTRTIHRLVDSGQLTGYKFGNNVLKLRLDQLDSIYTEK